jgi:hypothetical protein
MLEDKKPASASHGDVGDIFAQDNPEKRLDQIRALIESTYHNLDKISRMVEKLQQDQKKEMYKNMPGIEGIFDGLYLVSEDGTKHEVPANYAAKSRLVFGDKLKIVEEDGKKVFKQIQKPERKEVKGVLSKKEGKWYLLSDSGTYKISDTAAEFNKAELNEEAVALVPENQLNVPFAALDLIIRKGIPAAEITEKPVFKVEKAKETKEKKESKEIKPKKEETFSKPAPVFIREVVQKSFIKKPPFIRSKESMKENRKPVVNVTNVEKTIASRPKEFVAGLLEDDDLR